MRSSGTHVEELGAGALDVRDTLGGLDPRVIRPHAMRALLDDHVARRRDTRRELWALVLLQIWMEAPGCRSPAAAAPPAAHRPVPRSPWPGRRSRRRRPGGLHTCVARYLVDRSRQQSTLEQMNRRALSALRRAPQDKRLAQSRFPELTNPDAVPPRRPRYRSPPAW